MATVARPRLRLLEIATAPLRWLERSRGWRRRLLIVAYFLIGLVLVFFAWWGASLNGLPDVGEPFDVDKFTSESQVPDSENAFVLYRQAGAAFHDAAILHDWNTVYASLRSGWGQANPKMRDQLGPNHEALKLWREASQRSKSLPEPLDSVRSMESGDEIARQVMLGQLAMLEGSRHQAESRPGEALEWYLAALRACRHFSTNSRMTWRSAAMTIDISLRDRFVDWSRSADPQNLRKAIAAIADEDAYEAPLSGNLKVEYIAITHSLADLPRLAGALDAAGGSSYRYDEMPRALHFYWFVKREPERSRRVARLVFANWLAHVDKPPAVAPKLIGNSERGPVWNLYEADSTAPYAASAMDPKSLFSQIESTAMLWRFLTRYPDLGPSPTAQHQANATLMVLLAEQAYTLEKGQKPPSVQALVPEYLKSIPQTYVELEKPKP